MALPAQEMGLVGSRNPNYGKSEIEEQKALLRRHPFRLLRYVLVRKRAASLVFRMVTRRPVGIPGDRWNPNERREVYRNGHQPRLRQIASEKLSDLRWSQRA